MIEEEGEEEEVEETQTCYAKQATAARSEAAQ